MIGALTIKKQNQQTWKMCCHQVHHCTALQNEWGRMHIPSTQLQLECLADCLAHEVTPGAWFKLCFSRIFEKWQITYDCSSQRTASDFPLTRAICKIVNPSEVRRRSNVILCSAAHWWQQLEYQKLSRRCSFNDRGVPWPSTASLKTTADVVAEFLATPSVLSVAAVWLTRPTGEHKFDPNLALHFSARDTAQCYLFQQGQTGVWVLKPQIVLVETSKHHICQRILPENAHEDVISAHSSSGTLTAAQNKSYWTRR